MCRKQAEFKARSQKELADERKRIEEIGKENDQLNVKKEYLDG